MSPAGAAEFYSWIEPSGTAVLTDDPSRIPPADERSAVAIYRYPDRASSPPSPQRNMVGTEGLIGRAQPRMPESAAYAELSSVDPADIDAPDVLLDQPEQSFQSDYVWVPLQAPLLLSSRYVSGFWWRPGRASPTDGFNAALLQLARGTLKNHGMPNRHRAGVSAYGSAISSGNAVYDQVVRERHSLQQAAQSVFSVPRSTGAGVCCGTGRSSFSGGASVR
ncbi:MAG: hypothetical protein ACREJU_04820 [Nitrospiraceae bacterium]